MSWQRGWGEEIIGTHVERVYAPVSPPVRRGRGWRGVALAALLALGACGAGKAFGETIQIGRAYIHGEAFGSTTVTIEPSGIPGQLAVVTLDNRHVNQGSDDGVYTVTMDGVVFGIEFQWDADPVLGSDRITITPPLGITCDPVDCGVTVMEGMAGSVVLFDFMGF